MPEVKRSLSSWLALVGIADDVLLRPRAPSTASHLAPVGESRAAKPRQSGCLRRDRRQIPGLRQMPHRAESSFLIGIGRQSGLSRFQVLCGQFAATQSAQHQSASHCAAETSRKGMIVDRHRRSTVALAQAGNLLDGDGLLRHALKALLQDFASQLIGPAAKMARHIGAHVHPPTRGGGDRLKMRERSPRRRESAVAESWFCARGACILLVRQKIPVLILNGAQVVEDQSTIICVRPPFCFLQRACARSNPSSNFHKRPLMMRYKRLAVPGVSDTVPPSPGADNYSPLPPVHRDAGHCASPSCRGAVQPHAGHRRSAERIQRPG